MKDVNKISASRVQKGDYAACDLFVDLFDGIENALTDRQRLVFYLYYCREFTQYEVADRLGIARKNVQKHLKAIITNISEYLSGEKVA